MRLHLVAVGTAVLGTLVGGQSQLVTRLNPLIALLEQEKPVFGLYAPRPDRSARPDSAAGAPAATARSPMDLVRELLNYTSSDFVFDGSMEEGVDRGLPAFTAFASAMQEAGARAGTHPLIVKTQEIAPDPVLAIENISRQLNTGASGIMFVKVESAEEVRQGLAAMRFRSKGGTRPDEVGAAPAYWGLTEQEYRDKADLWPLDPTGELINWTIIESREGLTHVREIAAVKGIGVLWPGAGTLRRIFTTTTADGQRVIDAEGWEAAIQQVLAACKEFDLPCGYPANPGDIEMRMQQGFSVFVINWGEAGFKTVEIGRRVSGRTGSR